MRRSDSGRRARQMLVSELYARTAHYGPPLRTYNASPCGGTGAAHTHERMQRRSSPLVYARCAYA